MTSPTYSPGVRRVKWILIGIGTMNDSIKPHVC